MRHPSRTSGSLSYRTMTRRNGPENGRRPGSHPSTVAGRGEDAVMVVRLQGVAVTFKAEDPSRAKVDAEQLV